ncbi:MAG: nitroreductase family protein [Calditrichota bacterium]
MELHSLISKRWSPRAFSDKLIEQDKIDLLFQAARWSASSGNLQPWRFLYANRGDSTFDLMLECLMEGNQVWAKDAAMLIATVAVDINPFNDKPNGHAWHDIGLAIGNLSLQATAMDIYLHQMGGYFPEKARELLEIPEGYTPVTFIAAGYLGDAEQLPEKLREREGAARQRKELSEIVASGKWSFGETA